MECNLLAMLIVVPVISGIIFSFISDRFSALVKLATVLIAGASFAGTIYIFLNKPYYWNYNSLVILLADNLSGFIAMTIALFAVLITVFSLGFIEKLFNKYFGYMLVTLGASIGVVYANNLIVMLVCWGFLGAMLYLLVNLEDTKLASDASRKAIIIIAGTDVAMILGIAIMWVITGTFSIDKINLPLTGPLTYTAYFAIAIACFAKAGAIPFHSWLPDVAEGANASVVAYLPASLDKLLGIYLLSRASISLFTTTKLSNTVLLIIGAVTIVVAVMMALIQHNYKRLLGYHAVSQVGYMILGIGSGTVVGIAGGLFHMLNHAIYKSSLFLTSGAVEKRAKTMELSDLGGLAKFMPITFFVCLVASFSISGIPPFNGFVSKWMIYQGIVEGAVNKDKLWVIWIAAAMFGSALTIASFMKLLYSVFLGRPSEHIKNIQEVRPVMYVPMLILSILCITFGIFAFKVPLKLFIIPAIGALPIYIGTWSAILASVLILAGLLVGLFIYWAFNSKNVRVVDSFVGGADAQSLPRVTGTEFYNTIKEVPAVSMLYKEENKFDMYAISMNVLRLFSAPLKKLHNGVLPTYMVWCLLGMIGMFVILFTR